MQNIDNLFVVVSLDQINEIFNFKHLFWLPVGKVTKYFWSRFL